MAKKRTKSLPKSPPSIGPVLPSLLPKNKAHVSILLRVVLSLTVVGCLVVLIAWLGQLATSQLGSRDRYRVALSSVSFDTPAVVDRKSFLAEVRYVSALPESIDTADNQLPAVLKLAFEKHPWVERFEDVVVLPTGEVQLKILYRVPQMTILWRHANDLETRALDKHGVLLPINATTTNLPVLLNERGVPDAEAGKIWPEDEVLRALEFSMSYPLRTISRTKFGWSLIETSGRTMLINTP